MCLSGCVWVCMWMCEFGSMPLCMPETNNVCDWTGCRPGPLMWVYDTHRLRVWHFISKSWKPFHMSLNERAESCSVLYCGTHLHLSLPLLSLYHHPSLAHRCWNCFNPWWSVAVAFDMAQSDYPSLDHPSSLCSTGTSLSPIHRPPPMLHQPAHNLQYSVIFIISQLESFYNMSTSCFKWYHIHFERYEYSSNLLQMLIILLSIGTLNITSH